MGKTSLSCGSTGPGRHEETEKRVAPSTATEVMLLGIVALRAGQGVPYGVMEPGSGRMIPGIHPALRSEVEEVGKFGDKSTFCNLSSGESTLVVD